MTRPGRAPGAPPRDSRRGDARRVVVLLLAALALPLLLLLGGAASATTTPTVPEAPTSQQPAQPEVEPDAPGPGGVVGPGGPATRDGNDSSVTIDLGDLGQPSSSVTVILGLTLVSLLPAIMLTCTSFTKILIVLGLTRNALGLQQTPNNQVLAGLALFLSLFIMGPVLSEMNDIGLQPYLENQKTASVAIGDGIEPLRTFMLKHTDDEELSLLTSVAGRDLPDNPDEVGMTTLVPAFVLTELKQAFIIGFIVFIPFLVIDIVVSGALMALGMMMMPPVMVSLPFKLLLFVMVDGWALVIRSLVASYG